VDDAELLGERENGRISRLVGRTIARPQQANLAEKGRHRLRRLLIQPGIGAGLEPNVRRQGVALARFEAVEQPFQASAGEFPDRDL
jgi:hypothetical protein